MAAIMLGLPEPPYQPLYFTPFHCAGLCEEVIMMPPAAPRSRTPKLRAGVGVTASASCTGMPVAGGDFSAGACKCLRPETRVISDAETLGGISLRVNVGGDGFGSSADVGESEVVGNNSAPAVGAEFDYRVRHGTLRAP